MSTVNCPLLLDPVINFMSISENYTSIKITIHSGLLLSLYKWFTCQQFTSNVDRASLPVRLKVAYICFKQQHIIIPTCMPHALGTDMQEKETERRRYLSIIICPEQYSPGWKDKTLVGNYIINNFKVPWMQQHIQAGLPAPECCKVKQPMQM